MRKKLSQAKIRALLAQMPLTDVCSALICFWMARTQFHNPPADTLAPFRGFCRLFREMAKHFSAEQRFQIGEMLRDAADTIEHHDHVSRAGVDIARLR
jgi:hypothetical protein